MAAVDLDIDEAGGDPPAGGIDRRALLLGSTGADGGDDAAIEQHVAVREHACRRDDGSVDDSNGHETAW